MMWEMVRKCIFGRIIGWRIDLSYVFPRLFHLSSLENCFVSNFLVLLWISVTFSFDFYRLLSNGEMTKVASLLSLIEGFDFRLGRSDVPNLLEGFSCKSGF